MSIISVWSQTMNILKRAADTQSGVQGTQLWPLPWNDALCLIVIFNEAIKCLTTCNFIILIKSNKNHLVPLVGSIISI